MVKKLLPLSLTFILLFLLTINSAYAQSFSFRIAGFSSAGKAFSGPTRGGEALTQDEPFSLPLKNGDTISLPGPSSPKRTDTLPQFNQPGVVQAQLPSLDAPPAQTQPAPGTTAPPPSPTNPLLVPPTAPQSPLQPPEGQNIPVVWKKYNLLEAFGYNQLIEGYIEYPANWQVNLDIYNKMVVFSPDPQGTTSLTLMPGITGDFSSARDLAAQIIYLLSNNVPNLQVIKQDFKEDPKALQIGINLTRGQTILQGTFMGVPLTFQLMSYAHYVPAASIPFGIGGVILCQAPKDNFSETLQQFFNRMVASYEKSLGLYNF